jgi:type VI secretion system protein ImpK
MQFNAADPRAMPAIVRPAAASTVTAALVLPEPAQPAICGQLHQSLAPDIAGARVSVSCRAGVPMVRVSGNGMFVSGSARIEPAFLQPLARIGEVLKSEPGPVTVAGYTDSQPIRTLRFPSNYELSKARAEAAVAVLAKTIGNPARLTPEGRGDADPIELAPEHQDRNRRIEIILHQKG